MLVDVVPLRRCGIRLPREEVFAARPVRGLLQLSLERPAAYYRDKRNAPLVAGVVRADEPEWALPPLSSARVMKINRRGMLIVGVEEVPTMGRRGVDLVPQAWWVRVVTDPQSSGVKRAGTLTPA
jgi:hypothetical protein